ncbi:hypothetical protein [Streptomyces sp. B6B3]|uniref:hypothetical protein n=1 Tax=Streptomyces sp. B6B3 TaxID=3153570 RepID=UPI00325E8818
MTVVTRFVTHVELDEGGLDAGQLSVSARLTAALADGRGVTLLDDRGWSSWLHGAGADEAADAGSWVSAEGIEEIEETARMVVGPDEPFDGMTQAEAAAAHWAYLADILVRRGVAADAGELAGLPHDVVFGPRLRAAIARPGT